MNSKIFDSRSFNSNITSSDHQPVKAKIQIKYKYPKKISATRSFNLKEITKNRKKLMTQIHINIKNEKK